jgi:taspase (threonine aspartase 1)
VRLAIACLEDDSLTNAGAGANLTADGRVECDACIMEGRHGASGGVGAVQGVRNPIAAAHAVMRNARQGLGDLGLVPPTLLCGAGAHAFARAHGLAVGAPDDDAFLVTSAARARWGSHGERLRRYRAERGGAGGPPSPFPVLTGQVSSLPSY